MVTAVSCSCCNAVMLYFLLNSALHLWIISCLRKRGGRGARQTVKGLWETQKRNKVLYLYIACSQSALFPPGILQAQANIKRKVSVVFYSTTVYFWRQQPQNRRKLSLGFEFWGETADINKNSEILKKKKSLHVVKMCLNVMRIAFSSRSLYNTLYIQLST